MSETCQSCKFSSWPYLYNYPDQHPGDNGYKCRKSSPVPTGGQMSNAWTMWPRVKVDDWCGDYCADPDRKHLAETSYSENPDDQHPG